MPETQNLPTNAEDQNGLGVLHQEFSFSGPLPLPQILEHYERIVPGSARQIMEAADKQAELRMELEKQVVAADIFNSRLGLFFGFFTGLLGMAAAVLVAKFGYGTASSIIGGGTLVALVGAFIYGSQGKNMEK